MASDILPSRYGFFAGCIVVTAVASGLWAHTGFLWWLVLAVISGALSLVGVVDVAQKKHAIRRNYPVLAHLRFFLEFIRPEIRQYFLENDTDPVPFSRMERSIVYQRAKNAVDKRPFGTQLDVYEARYEWINHSLVPSHIKSQDFRVSVGSSQCLKPYSASVFNISAMSYGALSPNAILALNAGAKRGNFYHDTGEGSISTFHREHGGDLVWEIGSGYFGCRNKDGSFSEARFAENAAAPQVRMIELKLSQGAKPGHGGVLPGSKVNTAIAEARGVAIGEDCISPASHSAFSTPVQMMEFVARLRELSGGKPVGFKLSIGHPWEWFAIIKAIMKTGILPDFIVIDGGEGGTGAAPQEFTDHVGTPLRDSLVFAQNTLVAAGLRPQIRLGAAGKIITAFDIVRTCALGADWCNSARGFMFALGCLQAQICHTGHCPTGVTTQDPKRYRALDPGDKATRVHNFHENTLFALKELLSAAGVNHPAELGPEHIIRRVTPTEVRSLATLHLWLPANILRDGGMPEHRVFQMYWEASSPDTFGAPPAVLALRASKLA